MQVSRGWLRAAPLVAVGAALVFCPGASAAWFNGGDIGGPAGFAGFVTGPIAGQVGVAGLNFDTSALGAGHVPGGGFGPAALLAAGSDDAPASIGPGGAILAGGPQPVLRRQHVDGSASVAVPFGPQDATPIGNAAVAPSGAALAIIADPDEGDVQFWRQGAEGAALVQLTVPTLPDNASAASVVPYGNDGFIVVLAAPNDDAGNGVRLRGLIVTGTSVGASRVLETSATNSVSQIEGIPGPTPLAAWIDDADTSDRLMVAQVTATPNPQQIDATTGEDAGIDDFDAVATGSGGALAWSLSPDGEREISKYALLGPTGVGICAAAEPSFLAVAITDRGGTPVVGGLTADGRVGIVPAAPGCPVGTPQLSDPVPNAGDIALATDADGTLLAGVGRPEDTALRVQVDDITPPGVERPNVPATARTNQSFQGTVAAADPWGLADIAWSVDGDVVGHGASVTIPGQPNGTHTVSVLATNAAGLSATSSAPVVVSPAATPTPIPTTAPPPTATATPTPAPPVTAARDTTPPTIDHVTVTHEIFRPLATAAALPRGSGVHFTLSEAANVRATILRGKSKKHSKGRCQVPPAPGVPKTPLQGRRVLLVTRSLPAGKGTLRLDGRVASGKRLPRGRYRVSLQATDRAGNRSEPVFIRFTLC